MFSRFFLLALMLVCMAAPTPLYAEGHPPKGDHVEKKKGEGKEGKEGGVGTDLTYVHLQPMILPVISASGAEQLVTLQIDLQVKDYNAADTIHTNMPRVQDAIMRALYGGLGQGTLRNGHLVDIPKIKSKIAAALDQALGKDMVDEVLIQAVAQRML